jgi:gas vesicle protein
MQNNGSCEDEAKAKSEGGGLTSRITWLVAGIGIGALAGILLAPQSGEDTRGWISDKYDDGMNAARTKTKRSRRRLENWIDQGQERITDAVNAGGAALKKGISEVGA